jgi:hypothetical protein
MSMKLVLVVLLFCGVAYSLELGEFQSWEQCYGGDATVGIHVEGGSLKLIASDEGNVAARLSVRVNVDDREPILDGSYHKLEYWHESTGTKVKYRGPYNSCCGLALDSKCVVGQQSLSLSDCPMYGKQEFTMMRTLHKDDGKYEATFQMFDDEHKELVCVVFKFCVTQDNVVEATQHGAIHAARNDADYDDANNQQQQLLLSSH